MPDKDRQQCPVCKFAHQTRVKIDRDIDDPFVENIDCWRCGSYALSNNTNLPTGKYNDSRHLIVGYIREFNVKHYAPGLTKRFFIDEDRLQAIIHETSDYHVPRKTDKLLLALGALTKRPGLGIDIDANRDYPLAYAHDESEYYYYARYLIEEGLLNDQDPGNYTTAIVTPKGWARISELESKGIESKEVFVAMSFDPRYAELYEAIKDGVGMAGMGYIANRLDDPQDQQLIDNALIARMRESRFLVADLSQNNHGVYYEAGFTRALGRPVIYTCKRLDENGQLVDTQDPEELHFDVSHWPIIFWEEDRLEDFKQELADWIKAWAI